MPQEASKSRIATPTGAEDLIAVDTDGAQKKLSVDTVAGYVVAGGGGVPDTRAITAGAGLTGGGDLSADRTIDVAAADASITVNADSIQVGYSASAPAAATASAGSAGAAATAARSDHAHQVSTGTPTNVGTANASGSSSTLARSDHVHGPGPLVSDADADTKWETERTADDDTLYGRANSLDVLVATKSASAVQSAGGAGDTATRSSSATGNPYIVESAAKSGRTARAEQRLDDGTLGDITSLLYGDGTDTHIWGMQNLSGTLRFLGALYASSTERVAVEGSLAAGVSALRLKADSIALTGPVTASSTIDGRDVSVDGTKLDGIESGATADMTGAEIAAALVGQALTVANPLKVDAAAAGNANVYLRDEAALQQGVFFWQRSDDSVRIRRMAADGTSAEGELQLLSSTSIKYSGTELAKESRSVSTGTGLTGGGNLSADRTLSLDINGLTDIGAALADGDLLAVYDLSATAIRKSAASRIYDYILSKVPIAYSTWSPSFTNLTGLSAVTNNGSFYLRVGDIVLVAMNHTVTRNAATTPKRYDVSLPVASAFTTAFQAMGVGASDQAYEQWRFFSEATGDTLRVQWASATSAGSIDILTVGAYRIL
jgi:hypothetical protein